jgi:hypothetical protein
MSRGQVRALNEGAQRKPDTDCAPDCTVRARAALNPSSLHKDITLRPVLPAILFGIALAQTWIEQLTVIENGTFVGINGYPRGYIPRSDPGFCSFTMAYQISSLYSGRTK